MSLREEFIPQFDDDGNQTFIKTSTGIWQIPSLASVRYRFQGREWSAATGLVNFRMRWYDSETGRWLSKDPIGLNGGLNLYAFCLDFPLQNTDYNGCNPLLLNIAWPVLMETSIKLATFAGFAYEGWQLFAQYRKSCSGSGYSGGSGYKGERGRTARPDGTRNPDKKFRQNKDGRWEYQDSNGIWYKKPPGFKPFWEINIR